MGLMRDFVVTIKKTEVVAPEMPKQEHWLPQSNLDLLLPPVNPSSFFCYKKPLDDKFTFEVIVGILKKSLAQTLVPFYALAGEMVQNSAGEPEILCNNRGVDFTVAFADVELTDLNFYNPTEIGRKLIPTRKHGLLAVQVTELKCGGVVVASTVDHRQTDAYSAHMFFQSWAEVAQAKPLSHVPSFRRSMLFPRNPTRFDSSVEDMYVPISQLPPPTVGDEEEGVISRVFYVKAETISELQSLANNASNNDVKQKRTKLESFSAFLWKILASSVDDLASKICRLGVVVDGRSRLGIGDEEKAKTMEVYYGNVLSIPFGEKKCEELKDKPLSLVANDVNQFIHGATTKEHFLDLIDWVESRRPEPAMAKIYATRVRDEGPAVVVSSGLRFPVAMMDFGWGVAAFSSHYFPWGGQSGYVVPMPSPFGNGDWIIYMHLLKEQLDFIETNAAHVFNPLTSTYLNLI